MKKTVFINVIKIFIFFTCKQARFYPLKEYSVRDEIKIVYQIYLS